MTNNDILKIRQLINEIYQEPGIEIRTQKKLLVVRTLLASTTNDTEPETPEPSSPETEPTQTTLETYITSDVTDDE